MGGISSAVCVLLIFFMPSSLHLMSHCILHCTRPKVSNFFQTKKKEKGEYDAIR